MAHVGRVGAHARRHSRVDGARAVGRPAAGARRPRRGARPGSGPHARVRRLQHERVHGSDVGARSRVLHVDRTPSAGQPALDKGHTASTIPRVSSSGPTAGSTAACSTTCGRSRRSRRWASSRTRFRVKRCDRSPDPSTDAARVRFSLARDAHAHRRARRERAPCARCSIVRAHRRRGRRHVGRRRRGGPLVRRGVYFVRLDAPGACDAEDRAAE